MQDYLINQKLEALRELYRDETDPELKKVIAARGLALKMALEKSEKSSENLLSESDVFDILK